MTQGNPFSHNPRGWSYQAWEEGYHAAIGEKNPYLPQNEQLGEFWQDGRERAAYDRYLASKESPCR